MVEVEREELLRDPNQEASTMNSTLHAAHPAAFTLERPRALPRARSLRVDRLLARVALLAASACFTAAALRAGAEAGPSELYLLVFALGAIALVTALAWLLPFAGALLIGSAGTAIWIFLDATPLNAWLALAAYVAVGFLLHAWLVEARTSDAG